MHDVHYINSPSQLPDFTGKKNLIWLTDENVAVHCLPHIPGDIVNPTNTVIIPSGEENKSIDTSVRVFNKLVDWGADRDTTLISLGGGVITDIGGFVASTYKRGIRFIHIPTSLIGMADASIGGKTGVNLVGHKNLIGTFSLPEKVIIFTPFLRSLPSAHILSGFAELLKTGLIKDEHLWLKLAQVNPDKHLDWEPLIKSSVDIKLNLIYADLYDKGARQALNFGHTIGHAIEGWGMSEGQQSISHGKAVAAGILTEAFLSHLKTGLSKESLKRIVRMIDKFFPRITLQDSVIPSLIRLMRNDKKNENSEVKFTLLKSIGQYITSVTCNEDEITEALQFYSSK